MKFAFSSTVILGFALITSCGTPIDGGPLDAGAGAGAEADAGALADSGRPDDAGASADSGQSDAGVLNDAGPASTDAGPQAGDAGTTGADAGTATDAGADGGTFVDAGTGTSTDAGAPLDSTCPTHPVERGRITGADVFALDLGPGYYTSAQAGLYTRDVTGDHEPDILAFEYVSTTNSTYTYRIKLFVGKGNFTFEPMLTSDIVLPRYGAEFDALGDFNGDGRLDLLIGFTTEYPRTTYVYVALQNAAGTFTLQPSRRDLGVCGSSQDERRGGIAILDFDHDGFDDVLATVSLEGLGYGPLGLSLLRGGVTGLGSATCVGSVPKSVTDTTVTSPTLSTAGFPTELVRASMLRAADFDGDGRIDLIASVRNKLRYFQRLADGGFDEAPGDGGPFTTYGQYFVLPSAGDGGARLVASSVGSQSTQLYESRVDSVTGVSSSFLAELPVGYAPSSVEVLYGFTFGDFNHDGRTDLVEIGNHEFQVGPMPFTIGCDRSTHWEIDGGVLPESSRLLRTMNFADGGTALTSRVNADLVFFKLE